MCDWTDQYQKFSADYSERLRPETMRQCRMAVERFSTFINKDVQEIDESDVRKWLIYRKKLGVKPSTVNRNLEALRTFFKHLTDEELIENNPCTDISQIKTPSLLPRFMGQKELFKLREVSKDNLRDRAMLETLYATGVRANELVNIQLKDINWVDYEIFIQEGKGGISRYVLFNQECAEWLQTYLAQRIDNSPYLFPSRRSEHISTKQLQTVAKYYAWKAGIQQRITPQTFRHTFATQLASKKVPFEVIVELLGHNNFKNVGVYAKLVQTVKNSMYDKHYSD